MTVIIKEKGKNFASCSFYKEYIRNYIYIGSYICDYYIVFNNNYFQ